MLHGKTVQVVDVSDAKFLHEIAAMCLDRAMTDVECIPNLRAGAARQHQVKNLPFPKRQTA